MRVWWAIGMAVIAGVLSVEAGPWLMLGVLGLASVLVAIRQPRVAVLLAYGAILLDSQGMTGLRVAGLPLTLSKVAVLVALVAWLSHRLVHEQSLLPWTPLSGAVAGVLGSMLLSLAAVIDLRLAWIDLAGVIMLSLLLHLVFGVVRDSDLGTVVRWMAAMTIAVFAAVLWTGSSGGAVGSAHEAWHTRSSGAFTDPNAWATCVLVTSSFLIGALAHDRHRLARPLLLGLLVVAPAAVMQSMSRAGMVGTVVVAPVVLWAAWPQRRVLGVGVLSVAVVAPFVMNLDAVLLRYWTLVDPSVEAGVGGHSLRERQALVDAALAVIWSRPVFGVGVGNFRVVAEALTSGQVFKIAHNSYLTIAAEQGVPGIVTHLWLAVCTLHAAFVGALGAPEGVGRGVGRGFVAAVIAFGAMAATLNLATFAVGWYVFGVGLVAAERAVVRGSLPVSVPVPSGEAELARCR